LTVLIAFFTSNLGLSYTLKKIYYGDTNPVVNLPAIPYHNNTLDHCNVTRIDINLNRQDTSRDSGLWWSWGKSEAIVSLRFNLSKMMLIKEKATANCFVHNELPHRPVIEVQTTYQIREAGNFDAFVRMDNQSAASLWWGAQLM